MIETSRQSDVTIVKGLVKFEGITLCIHFFLTDHMLIDCGPVSLLNQLVPFFQEEEFDFVALTHYHEDHTGCAPWLQQNKNIPIYIKDMSIQKCWEIDEYPRFRKGFWGEREGFLAQPLGKKIQSRTGSWEVISTPGHSNDHVVFLNTATGVLFSGDLFIHSKIKAILREESITEMIASLQKILQYDFQEMFCAHAGYIPDGKLYLQKKVDYLINLQSEILHFHEQGLTNVEINQAIFSKPPTLISISDHEWDSIHIINSVINEIKY